MLSEWGFVVIETLPEYFGVLLREYRKNQNFIQFRSNLYVETLILRRW